MRLSPAAAVLLARVAGSLAVALPPIIKAVQHNGVVSPVGPPSNGTTLTLSSSTTETRIPASLTPTALQSTTTCTVAAPHRSHAHAHAHGPSVLDALPGNASAAALAFQPLMDFEPYCCYNTPAIDARGRLHPGMSPRWAWWSRDCTDPASLTPRRNNVYVRRRCNHGWCAWMYEYYFPKDVVSHRAADPFRLGHRHDWENVVVWTSAPHRGTADDDDTPPARARAGDPGLDRWIPRYIAVSQHGRYKITAPRPVRFRGTHVQVVYRRDGLLTRTMRPAWRRRCDDRVRNHTGAWFRGTLVEYGGFPRGYRDRMLAKDWGAADVSMMDGRFERRLRQARDRSRFARGFDPSYDAYPDVPQYALGAWAGWGEESDPGVEAEAEA